MSHHIRKKVLDFEIGDIFSEVMPIFRFSRREAFSALFPRHSGSLGHLSSKGQKIQSVDLRTLRYWLGVVSVNSLNARLKGPTDRYPTFLANSAIDV